MKKTLLLMLLLVCLTSTIYGQDTQIQQAIEAEQFEKAKEILVKTCQAEIVDGTLFFQLGTLYLQCKNYDSAKIVFEKGQQLKENGHLNFIGLGAIDLDNNRIDDAKSNFDKALLKTKRKSTKELLAIAQVYTKSDIPNYEKAIEYANKAIAIDPKLAEAYIALGDAEYGKLAVSEAYSAYRNAYDLDNNLLRAKLQLAVLTKGSKAFPEAIEALNELLNVQPNYGPAYRELAETYYLWGTNDRAKYATNTGMALNFYKKYMDLTDYSLESRMRYADFLILTKNYKTLQKEADEMQKIDHVNVRILRYLGYSACENGNYPEAINALSDFVEKVEPRRLLPLDYAYLAKAYLALSYKMGVGITDTVQFEKMLTALTIAYQKKAEIGNEYRELGILFYKEKDYLNAYKVLEVVLLDSTSKLIDNFYFANAVFYYMSSRTEEERLASQKLLLKADTAYATIVKESPTTQDAYFNRARLNRYIQVPQAETNVATYFSMYIASVQGKGDAELAKSKNKLSEAYTSIGAHYAETNKEMAIENFEKAVVLDPSNEHAIQSLSFLKNKIESTQKSIISN